LRLVERRAVLVPYFELTWLRIGLDTGDVTSTIQIQW
jgi:hypothetical protein